MTNISIISGTTYVTRPGYTVDDDIQYYTNLWNAQNSATVQAKESSDSSSDQVSFYLNMLLDLSNHFPPASQEDLNTALTGLQAATTNFSGAHAQYQTALTTLNNISVNLINAKATKQKQLDSSYNTQITSDINALNLSGSDPVSASELASANARRQSDRNALNEDINDLRDTSYTVAQNNITLQSKIAQQTVAKANAILNNPTNPSNWQAAVTNAANTYQPAIDALNNALSNTLIPQRSALIINVQGDISLLNTEMNSSNGLITLLNTLKDSQGPAVSAIIQAIQDAQDNVTTWTNEYIQHQKDLDTAAVSAYELAHPSSSTIGASQIALLKEQFSSLIDSTSDANAFFTSLLQINVPKLEPGKPISLADIMRMISGSLLLIQDTAKLSLLNDAQLSILRALIFSYLLSQGAQTLNILTMYAQQLTLSAMQFNSENATRVKSLADQLQFLSTNLSTINNVIDQVNASNSALNTENAAVATALTDATQGTAKVLNEAQNSPEAVNFFDLLGQDPTVTLPPPFTVPAAVTGDQIQQFAHLSVPTVPSAIPPATQAQIDAYNAAILNVNQTLAALQTQLLSAGVDITQINLSNPANPYFSPAVFRDLVPLPTIRANIGAAIFESITAAMTSIIQYAASNFGVNLDKEDAISVFLGMAFGRPYKATVTTTGPISGGLAGAETDTAVGDVQAAIVKILGSKDFRDSVKQLIESQSVLAALGVGALPPQSLKGYSSYGIIAEIPVTAISDKQLAELVKGLQQLSSQLLALLTNSSLLTQIATALAITKAPNLSDADRQDLIQFLAKALQLSLLIMATLSGAAAVVTPLTASEAKAQGELGIPEFNISLGSKSLMAAAQDLLFTSPTTSALLASPYTPITPQYVGTLLAGMTGTDTEKQAALLSSLAQAGVPSATIERIQQSPLAFNEAVTQGLSKVASDFIASLNINLSALSADQTAKIIEIIAKNISEISILTEEEKMKLIIAMATGRVPGSVAEISQWLNALQLKNMSIATVQDAYSLFPSTYIETFSLRSKFQEALKTAYTDQKEADRAVQLADKFTESVALQTDFGAVALRYIFNLAHVFTASFSMFTEGTTKPGTKPIRPTLMG